MQENQNLEPDSRSPTEATISSILYISEPTPELDANFRHNGLPGWVLLEAGFTPVQTRFESLTQNHLNQKKIAGPDPSQAGELSCRAHTVKPALKKIQNIKDDH